MTYVRVLRTYRYIDKNPIIDIARTAVQDAGLMKRLQVAADLASLNVNTLRGWFEGDVRDPRHSSTAALLIAMGWENKWSKARKLDVDKELEFARAWLKKERAKEKAARATTPRKKRKARKNKVA